MWHEVDLHGLHIFERMVGFSVPVEGELAIIAYDGIHLLDLHEPQSVRQDTAHPEGGHLYDRGPAAAAPIRSGRTRGHGRAKWPENARIVVTPLLWPGRRTGILQFL
jgi:hypothetical protein